MQVMFMDSRAHNTTGSDWLPGGIMIVIGGNISSLVQRDKVKIDLLGKWMVY